MLWPVVKRIAPKLTGRGEIIRRNSGDNCRIAFAIQIKEFRMTPDIGTVHGNENRNIADNLDALTVSVVHQIIPLLEEIEL